MKQKNNFYQKYFNTLKDSPHINHLNARIENHFLQGLIFKDFGDHLPPSLHNKYKTAWKLQWLHNENYLNELLFIDQQSANREIFPVVLKGASLLRDIYPDLGSRHLSDIDLLIPPAHLPAIMEILSAKGYSLLETTKWKANQFKFLLTRNENNFEYNIELHTQLFYHLPADTKWETESFGSGNLKKLKDEDHIVYLVGHLAFQHTFLKLYWIIDLDRLIRKKQLDWKKIVNLTLKYRLKNSLKMSLWLLYKYFQTPIPLEILQKLKINSFYLWKLFLNDKLLWEEKNKKFSYYFVKQFTKDSLWESLKYNLLWFKNRWWKTN